MSIVDKYEQVVDPAGGGDECSPFGIERPKFAGWVTVLEYKPVGGSVMKVGKRKFVAFFGRTAPSFINSNK